MIILPRQARDKHIEKLITKRRFSQVELESKRLLHLEPMGAQEETAGASHFPFGGAGARPPSRAGPVAELHVAAAATARSISVFVV